MTMITPRCNTMLEVEPVLPLVVSVCQHSMLFGDEDTNADCVSFDVNEPVKNREEKGLWGVHVDPSAIIPSTEGGNEGIKGALLLLLR